MAGKPLNKTSALEQQGRNKRQRVLGLQLGFWPAQTASALWLPLGRRDLPGALQLPNSLQVSAALGTCLDCCCTDHGGLAGCLPPAFPGLLTSWELTYSKSPSVPNQFRPGRDADKQMQSRRDSQGHAGQSWLTPWPSQDSGQGTPICTLGSVISNFPWPQGLGELFEKKILEKYFFTQV